jgi:hypothetical protein
MRDIRGEGNQLLYSRLPSVIIAAHGPMWRRRQLTEDLNSGEGGFPPGSEPLLYFLGTRLMPRHGPMFGRFYYIMHIGVWFPPGTTAYPSTYTYKGFGFFSSRFHTMHCCNYIYIYHKLQYQQTDRFSWKSIKSVWNGFFDSPKTD